MRRALSFSRKEKTPFSTTSVDVPAASPAQGYASNATPRPAPPRRSLSFGRRKGGSLPRDWQKSTDDEGRVCYVHKRTGQRSYEWPEPLPPGWRAAIDPETSVVYYWNKTTHEVLWSPPRAGGGMAAEAAGATAARGKAVAGAAAAATAAATAVSAARRTSAAPNGGAAAESAACNGSQNDRAGGQQTQSKIASTKGTLGRKLSFGRRKAANGAGAVAEGGTSGGVGGVTRGSNGGGDVGAAAGAPAGNSQGPSVSVGAFGRRADLDVRDYMFSKRKSECLVKLPGEVSGQQFIIEECEDCDIYVLDYSAQVTIDLCRRCRIFLGPVESSVFIRDSSDIAAVIACQQLRTRTVTNLTALLHSVSQPSVEETSGARFGCFNFYYPELQSQLASARLSPFNNRWNEPYNFTPKAGTVETMEPDVAYTQLLLPLSQICPQLLSVDDEERVASLCPVPRTLGIHSAAANAERGFLIILPRCAPHALAWLRTLVDGAFGDKAVVLLRAKEYTKVPSDFAQRLFAQSAHERKLSELARKGRLVGFSLSGSDVMNELAQKTATWNAEPGMAGGAAYAAATISEVAYMCQVFFEDNDRGQAMS